MDAADFRRTALSFEGTEEGSPAARARPAEGRAPAPKNLLEVTWQFLGRAGPWGISLLSPWGPFLKLWEGDVFSVAKATKQGSREGRKKSSAAVEFLHSVGIYVPPVFVFPLSFTRRQGVQSSGKGLATGFATLTKEVIHEVS